MPGLLLVTQRLLSDTSRIDAPWTNNKGKSKGDQSQPQGLASGFPAFCVWWLRQQETNSEFNSFFKRQRQSQAVA